MNLRQKAGISALRAARGVTLVELMVGMAIGLLSVVVITQVMVNAEGQKRTTMSGSDAQVNGALALDMLQREIRSSGYGIVNHSAGLGCPIVGKHANGSVLTPPTSWVLTAVSIQDGGTPGAPDTIRVMRSDARTMSMPLRVDANHLQIGTFFDMANNIGAYVTPGDVMLAVPPKVEAGTWCTLFSVSDAPDAATPKRLPHVANAALGAWNSVPSNFPATGYPSGSVLVNLGTVVNRSYGIAGGELTRTAFSSTTGKFAAAEPMFSQIVNLQAVYGKEVAPVGLPQGQAGTWNVVQPTTPAEWAQIFAVRVALVARSGLRERDEVTTAPPTWTPDGVTPTPIPLDADPDWKFYRYRVYETVVPLRNRLWHSMTEDEVKALSAEGN